MLGIVVMLLAAGFLSILNVIVRVFFQGYAGIGGLFPPDFEHTVLFLQTRTLFMVIFLSLLTWTVYPKAFLDIANGGTRLKSPLLSGSIYFVTVILLYLALGNIPAGIAITLFFVHPAIATLLEWWFNRDRPTLFRWAIIIGVIIGLVLVAPNLQGNFSSQFIIGTLCALGAGIGFAVYAITAQTALLYFHPLSFSLITFTLLFLLSSITVLRLNSEVPQAVWLPLLVWSMASGLITVGGLVLTNLGIRLVGAATATLVGSIEPALTACLAWLILQETLDPRQMIGIAIVTLSIAGLGLEQKQSRLHGN